MLAWSSVFFCVCLNRRRQENKGILSVPWFRTSRPAFWRWWVSAFTADNKLTSNIYLFFFCQFLQKQTSKCVCDTGTEQVWGALSGAKICRCVCSRFSRCFAGCCRFAVHELRPLKSPFLQIWRAGVSLLGAAKVRILRCFCIFVRHFNNLSQNTTFDNRCVFFSSSLAGKDKTKLTLQVRQLSSLTLLEPPESGVLGWIFKDVKDHAFSYFFVSFGSGDYT